MIPIRHTLPPQTTPVVNRAIVIANGIVFLTQLFLGQRTEMLINVFGFVPARLVHPAAYGYSMFEVAVTLITCAPWIRFGSLALSNVSDCEWWVNR